MCHVSNVGFLYSGCLEGTAEHTLFDCLYWVAKSFVGGRNIASNSIQHILSGPADLLSRAKDRERLERLSAASGRSAQSFYRMVEDIQCRKKQDERDG